MLRPHLALGLCALALVAATYSVGQQPAPDLTSTTERQGAQIASIQPNAQGVTPSALRTVGDQATDHPTWREQPSLMDSSWQRWPSLTDF